MKDDFPHLADALRDIKGDAKFVDPEPTRVTRRPHYRTDAEVREAAAKSNRPEAEYDDTLWGRIEAAIHLASVLGENAYDVIEGRGLAELRRHILHEITLLFGTGQNEPTGIIEGDSLVGTELDNVKDDIVPVNRRQVGGTHYGLRSYQHWDMVAEFNLDYFQGQITKYVMRWRDKNGVEDLEKAGHYLEKYMEIERARQSFPTVGNEIAADADQIPLSMNDAPEITQ